MADPFPLPPQQPSGLAYFPRRSHNGLSAKLTSEESFQNFYRQITVGQSSYDPPQGLPTQSLEQSRVNLAAYVTEQTSYSGYDFMQQYQNNLQDSSAKQGGLQKLDLLRQNMEQSFQDTQYLLRSKEYATVDTDNSLPDRRIEMQQRQQQELEQRLANSQAEQNRAESYAQKQAEQADLNRDEQQTLATQKRKEEFATRAEVQRLASQKLKAEHSQATDPESKAVTAAEKRSADKLKKTKNALQHIDSGLTVGAIEESKGSKNRELQEPAKAKHLAKVASASQAQLPSELKSQLDNQRDVETKTTLIQSSRQLKNRDGHKAEKQERPVSGHHSGDNDKLKIQVIDERNAKPQLAKAATAVPKEQIAGDTAQQGKQFQLRQNLAAQATLVASSEKDGKSHTVEPKGQSRPTELDQNIQNVNHVQDLGKGLGLDSRLGQKLGRVAELRRQQSQGMQYASGDKQNAASASGNVNGSDKQQFKAGFELSRSSGSSSVNDSLGSHNLQPSNGLGGINGQSAQGVLLRSVAQQMAQRLQEGPLAQNLRQLQFRLLDQNRGEIRLRLNPENLGQLRIHLNIDGSQLSGRIVADSAEAARILQDNLQHLEASLREGGFENQGLDVSVGGGQAGNEGRSAQDSAASRRSNQLRLNDEPSWEEFGQGSLALQQEQSQINYSV